MGAIFDFCIFAACRLSGGGIPNRGGPTEAIRAPGVPVPRRNHGTGRTAGLWLFPILGGLAHADSAVINTEPPQPWQGEIAGVAYSATSYDWETVTIEFALDDALAEVMEVNARDGKPGAVPDKIAVDVEALLELGANYVDIGFNTNRLAAEIPFAHVDVDRALAEKVVEHLVNIRTLLQ